MDGPEPRSRRAGPAALLAALLAAAGCASSPGGIADIDPDDLSETQLVEEAQRALAAGEIDRAIETSEALLERTDDGARRQSGLFVAAQARQADGSPVKAFRHYQSLLRDFPWSNYVPRCEEPVWRLAAEWLAEEPWFFFGDLFTGRERGFEAMREFAASFPSSPRADDALAAMAGYRFGRAEYVEAQSHYAQLARSYPDSEWADLASYRRAECWQLAARGAAYDPTPLLAAARDYRRYLGERPRGERVEQARAHARDVDELIAEGEFLRAELYLDREEDAGARMHLANVVLAYPESAAATRAREILAERGWDLSIHSIDTLQAPPVAEDLGR